MLPIAAISTPRRELFQELKRRLQGAPGAVGVNLDRVLPTSVAAVDALLGGGFPVGSLVTLEGRGCWGIAAALLAQVTRRGLGAIIDERELYPPSLEAAGIRLERLIIVPAKTPLHIARAADMLLRSRTARVVVMAATTLRAPVWARLANLAHRTGVVLVVVAARALTELQGIAAMRLDCAFERAIVRGTRGVWCTFCGFDLHAALRKHKRASSGAFVCVRSSVPATAEA